MSALNYPTLVLNADFKPLSMHPISTWSMPRALRNTLRGTAIVVEEYDAELRSQRSVYLPPSVVALVRYQPRPERVPFTRFNIFLRDDFRCQYCGHRFPASELTFDHVIPRSRGGETNARNIVSACQTCNGRKGDRTEMKPIRPPRDLVPADLRKGAMEKLTLYKGWIDYLYWESVIDQD